MKEVPTIISQGWQTTKKYLINEGGTKNYVSRLTDTENISRRILFFLVEIYAFKRIPGLKLTVY